MDTPKIYVACLAAYNNGFLYGEWIDATKDVDDVYSDIRDLLAKSPVHDSEEWAIHDYEGFGNANLSEYEGVESVVKIARFIVEHKELGSSLLGDYTVEEAETLLEENYQGTFDSEKDFAYEIFEECYSGAIPNNLQYYFNYEAFSRDLFMSDYFSVECHGKVHVFSNY